jgi:hypothetical protein
MQNLGFKNILGVKDGATVQCMESALPGGTGTLHNLQFDQNGNWLTATGNNFLIYASENYDGVNLSSACPSIANEGHVYQSYGRIVGIQTNGTGIFEYQPLMVSLGMVSIFLAIVMIGIRKAQQGIRNVTEETSEDDPLEWYEGPDGRQYWRVKRSIRRKMGYD